MAAYIRHFMPSVSQGLRNAVTRPSTAPFVFNPSSTSHHFDVMIMQTRCYPARKGTRERKLKLKRARKLLLQARAAQKDRADAVISSRTKAANAQLASRLRTSLDLTQPDRTTSALDDVWITFFFKRQLTPLMEAIEMHRDSAHPTVMNMPNAPLFLSLELDMKSGQKKNKYLDNFNAVVRPPHFFDDGKLKTLIAFCKDDEGQQQAMTAGADMVGGSQLIKRVQGGEAILADYKYIVAHPNILVELGSLRGIMKKRFPIPAKGTVGANMTELVEHFKKGVEFVSECDNVLRDFGWVDVQVGELSMSTEQIESNVKEIVSAVCLQRPAKLGPFVTIAELTCPPSKEKILVDVTAFLPSVPEEEDDADEVAAEEIGKKS